jgi:hypothetical protein
VCRVRSCEFVHILFISVCHGCRLLLGSSGHPGLLDSSRASRCSARAAGLTRDAGPALVAQQVCVCAGLQSHVARTHSQTARGSVVATLFVCRLAAGCVLLWMAAV